MWVHSVSSTHWALWPSSPRCGEMLDSDFHQTTGGRRCVLRFQGWCWHRWPRRVTLCHLAHESHNLCRLSHDARFLWRPPESEPSPRPSDWVTPSVIPPQIHHCHQPGTPFNNLFRNSNSDTRFLLSELFHEHDLTCCRLVNALPWSVAGRRINKIKSTSTRKKTH